MSSIKLKHSGGNSVSLNPPTSAPTSSEVAFKLPNADGSANQIMKTDGSGNLGWATDQGGKLLQLKYAVKNNTTSLSSVTTPSEVSSDLRVTITPTSGSSLMIVTANLFQSKLEGDNTSYRMYKSSSTNMSSPSFVQSASTINGSQDGNLNIIFDNSGGTPRSNLAVLLKVFEVAGNTNERTYSPFWCITGGTTYLNSYSGGGYFGTSGMTVMEVDIS